MRNELLKKVHKNLFPTGIKKQSRISYIGKKEITIHIEQFYDLLY